MKRRLLLLLLLASCCIAVCLRAQSKDAPSSRIAEITLSGSSSNRVQQLINYGREHGLSIQTAYDPSLLDPLVLAVWPWHAEPPLTEVALRDVTIDQALTRATPAETKHVWIGNTALLFPARKKEIIGTVFLQVLDEKSKEPITDARFALTGDGAYRLHKVLSDKNGYAIAYSFVREAYRVARGWQLVPDEEDSLTLTIEAAGYEKTDVMIPASVMAPSEYPVEREATLRRSRPGGHKD